MVEQNYNESWISQPDVCRCCLATSGTWDVTGSYVTETGDKEVYSDMLEECYGITLSYRSVWGPSKMVCALCVRQLRDALTFRKQVMLCEQQFVAYRNNAQSLSKPAVLREEAKKAPASDTSDDDDPKTVDVLGTDSTDKERPIVDRMRLRPKKLSGTSRSKVHHVESQPDLDSETVISDISKKNIVPESGADRADDETFELDSIASVELPPTKGFLFTRPQTVKQVSERKRVMLTCDTILRDTTACPFRHHKSWFQCFFCQQDFMELNLLRDHTLNIHTNIDDEIKKIKRYPRSLQIEISNLECRHCKLNLTDVNSMRGHFIDVHKKVIYKECIADYKVDCSPYSCHLCGQQFHVFRRLTTHLNEHYANCICDVCGKSFLNSKRLKVHKRTHENGDFPCSECGKVLKTKISKANHMESAHSNRIIKCQICFKPMKHYNDRIKHMSEVHNITHKFKCPICSREYNIKHYLATHIRQTHGHKNKKCLECGMAFITNHGLKKHMLKHTGVKPFACSICCKSYARSYTLREHMRTHDNEKFIGTE